MFVNDRRDNWHELLPFVMHAYRTSIHESTGYSPYRLMMGEKCSLPQDVNTEELRSSRENEVAAHPFAAWVRDALEVAYDQVRHSLNRTAARRKRLYDVKAVNRKFPVGSWVLWYYPPAAQKKLGSPWMWYDKQPATLLVYKKDRTPPLSSYTSMTLRETVDTRTIYSQITVC